MKLRFTVVDGLGAKATRTVELMVKNYSNTPPTANAGPDMAVAPGGFCTYHVRAIYGDATSPKGNIRDVTPASEPPPCPAFEKGGLQWFPDRIGFATPSRIRESSRKSARTAGLSLP